MLSPVTSTRRGRPSATAAATAPAAAADSYAPGAPGGGDPFFPAAGNGGYDARH